MTLSRFSRLQTIFLKKHHYFRPSDRASCPRPAGFCTHAGATYTELDCGGVTVPNCWDGTSYWQVSGPGCQVVGPISHLGDGNCGTAILWDSTPATCASEGDT